MLLSLCSLSGLVRAGCDAPRAGIGPQLAYSRWDEVDAQGRRLLRESGMLAGIALELALDCGGWQGAAHWSWRSGGRDYRGLSSLGAPITTVSDIDERVFRLELRHPLSKAWTVDWDWGLRFDARGQDRRLATTGAVLGYPEAHRSATLALGLAAAVPVRSGWAWRGEFWLGGGPSGSVEIDFAHADPVRLSSGARVVGEAALSLVQPRQGRRWWLELSLLVRGEQVRAGPAGALWRNGALVGAARQPEQHVLETGAGARLVWAL